uniref:Uncharacterized protein n=1 Tax=Laticauda laticaudata TaxID=8630 RepID=A0A8C5SS75_LATLA
NVCSAFHKSAEHLILALPPTAQCLFPLFLPLTANSMIIDTDRLRVTVKGVHVVCFHFCLVRKNLPCLGIWEGRFLREVED